MSIPATSSVAITGAGANLTIGSGNAAVQVNYLETISFSGAKTTTVNITNASSPTAGTGGLLVNEFLPTVIDSGTMDLTGIYAPNDPGQAALLSAWQNGNIQAFSLAMKPAANQTSGTTIAFNAYVTGSTLPDSIPFDKQVTFKSMLTVSGAFTVTPGTLASGDTD